MGSAEHTFRLTLWRPQTRLSIPILTLLLTIISFSLPVSAFALSPWARSFGDHPTYRLPRYVTGFSSVERTRTGALEQVRQQAMDDLVHSVRTTIRSEIVTRSRDDGVRSSGSYTSLTRSSSELIVANPRFLIDEDSQRYYALAYVEVSTLIETYQDSIQSRDRELSQIIELARNQIRDGRIQAAQRSVAEARRILEQQDIDHALVASLLRLSGGPVGGVAAQATTESLAQMADHRSRTQAAIADIEAAVDEFVPLTWQQAVEFSARRLADSHYRIAAHVPLRYQGTEISSDFGRRFVGAVADELIRTAGANRDATDGILEGAYWIDEEELEISLRVRNPETGRVLAADRYTVSSGIAGSVSLVPDNADQAIQNEQLLIGDAVTDGGLSVEVWTNKGRDQEVLVFEEGEEVQFYFRVNQPAFLRLTYELSTGDMVLLEPRFYIGTDRVNQIVALPYQFMVVPPFGVERLIVTGFSQEPPPADTIVRVISGQQYEVFRSAEDVVVRTRGLARVNRSEDASAMRVGEQTLTLTTVGQ